MEEKKCIILDYSFIIYNGSFAHKRPCSCITVEDGVTYAETDCVYCEGTGMAKLHANGIRTGGLYQLFYHIVPKLEAGYEVISVFDPPKADLVRTELLADYKGNRPPTPDWIEWQMSWGEKFLPMTKKIQCFTAENEESDDVISRIALEKEAEGYDVIVYTDDKDMFPLLVKPKIKLFRQKELFDKARFGQYMKKKYDINFTDPGRFSEFLAITGDVADNYNIIKGLGPKAAEYFLNKYDNILDLWDDFANIEDKYKRKLIKTCDGSACKKCAHNPRKDKPCPNRGTEVEYLKDELKLSLDLAYLNLEAPYRNINVSPEIDLVKGQLQKLKLYSVLNKIDLLF